MDGIPKGRQGDSSDDEGEDTRIPEAVRIEAHRKENEANKGKPVEKHHEETEAEGDGQSEKQKA